MARWERDPKLRQRLGWLLAVVEVLAVSANFYPIYTAYFHQIILRLSSAKSLLIPWGVEMAIGIVVSAAFLALAAYEGYGYVQGRAWARRAFIVENLVLIALGVIWFIKNRFCGGGADAVAAVGGLALPIATIFPLLWPLIAFDPVLAPSDPDTAAP